MREADLFIRHQPLQPCIFFCQPLAACCLRLEFSANSDFSVSSTPSSRGFRPRLWPSFSVSLSFFNCYLSKCSLVKFLATSPPAPSFSDRQLSFSRLHTSCGKVFTVFHLAPSFPGWPLSPTTTSQDCSFVMFLPASPLDQCFSSCQLARMQPHEAAESVRSHKQLSSSYV